MSFFVIILNLWHYRYFLYCPCVYFHLFYHRLPNDIVSWLEAALIMRRSQCLYNVRFRDREGVVWPDQLRTFLEAVLAVNLWCSECADCGEGWCYLFSLLLGGHLSWPVNASFNIWDWPGDSTLTLIKGAKIGCRRGYSRITLSHLCCQLGQCSTHYIHTYTLHSFMHMIGQCSTHYRHTYTLHSFMHIWKVLFRVSWLCLIILLFLI